MNWYNEIEPYAADWLESLIAAGQIPEGKVERQSISTITSVEIAGSTQAHFFAGIGGWPLALRLAGWPPTKPVWTGSCPCGPFSIAGKQLGTADERHLWPHFRRLITLGRPATIFGEQVASPAGREWLTGVRADLEALGYRFGSADLCAACLGSPHIRQRLFWVALAGSQQKVGGLLRSTEGYGSDCGGTSDEFRGSSGADWLVDSIEPRLERFSRYVDLWSEPGRNDSVTRGSTTTPGGDGYWNQFDLAYSIDGKVRRIEPGTFPLAHGVPARVGKLRAYGNAIVPQVAAEFIKAFMEVRDAVS